MKKVYVTVVFLTLCAIVLAWRRFGVRPAGVPLTAVWVNGNYIDCISHKLPVEHPCTVYKGSTGQVLDSQPITERLKSLASRQGGSPTDCGRTPTRNPESRVSECGQAAFQHRKPFYVQYDSPLTIFPFAYGLAGDANGNVSSVVYDGRGFPSVAPTRETQVLDQNHTRVTGCIRPITLGETEDGMLACITPVNEKESAIAAEQKPIETTVCAVAENPAAFNNRMVRIRGHVSGNFEYSMLDGEGCTDSIWCSRVACSEILDEIRRLHPLSTPERIPNHLPDSKIASRLSPPASNSLSPPFFSTFVTLSWAVEGGILALILPLFLADSIFRV